MISEERLRELANSPYRIVPKQPRKRSHGKNLHPQLTLRVDPELVIQVRNKLDNLKKVLRDKGIFISYLQNLNTLCRHLFDQYLDGNYDYLSEYPKIMLPTDCGQIAVRYDKEKIKQLKEKANNSGHTYVSITTWILKEWLKEE